MQVFSVVITGELSDFFFFIHSVLSMKVRNGCYYVADLKV